MSLDSLRGALADRYPIERELGQGGMATVYLAHDVKHGRRVALKVLRPELAATLGPDRFVREITIAAQLAHPHILPLFDSGEAAGFLYYVMPYVDGESLRDRLDREGPLPVAEAVRLTQQIASALAHAHDRGVIHRDIKPENILLTGDQAIVADFGIARAVEAAGGDKLTETGLAVGTPAYMSPEQAFGGEALGATTDVYSLGCVVFEMLTGRTPFQGPTPQAVLAQHAADTVPGLRASNAALPVPLERAVQQALTKEPAARYQSATALAEALEEALTPEAAQAEARRVSRRRWVRGLAVTAIVALLSVGGWWLTGTLSAHPIRKLAVLPASNMTRDTAQNYFVDGVHEALVSELQRAGIAVIARQSVLRYRGTDKPIRQIARELGVDALIQPAVGREGDSVLVDVTLYDGRSQLALWTGEFPAHVSGVLALYRTISGQVATAIGAALSEQARARLAQRDTVDPRAYDAVLKGQQRVQRYTPADFDVALGYFESALAIDSAYAPAYLGVAGVWGARAQYGLVTAGEARLHFNRNLDKAMALDPDLPAAHASLAVKLVWLDWDFEAGAAEYRRVIALDPNDALSHVYFGHVLSILGRTDEALAQGRLAVQLDPLSTWMQRMYAAVLVQAGRPLEALQVYRALQRQDPSLIEQPWEILFALGRKDEYVQALMREARGEGDSAFAAAVERGWHDGGAARASAAAAELLIARSDTMFVPAWQVAYGYALAGENEKAIDWLERAVEQHDQNVPYMGVQPVFRHLRDNPRFRALARKVGIPLWKGTNVP